MRDVVAPTAEATKTALSDRWWSGVGVVTVNLGRLWSHDVCCALSYRFKPDLPVMIGVRIGSRCCPIPPRESSLDRLQQRVASCAPLQTFAERIAIPADVFAREAAG